MTPGDGEFTAGHQRACHRSGSSTMASEAGCTWPASTWRLPKARISSSATPTFSRVLDSEAFCPFGVDG